MVDDAPKLHLEALVVDAHDPTMLGRFWSGLLQAPIAEQSEQGTRLRYPGLTDFFVDFVPVPDREPRPHRLHLDVFGGERRDEMVEQALATGAAHVNIGQHDVPWVVLVDPEDYAFCVMPEREFYRSTGPIGGLPLDADDISAATEFWLAASDWVPDDRYEHTLRHPSGTGPLLAFTEPVEPKRGKNPMHLDLRVPPGGDNDAALAVLLDLGARKLDHDWGELPWTVLVDPGNNEFCLLPSSL
ncbi:VOC family protein [Pseudactinotalea terrae]|uniref:VOC family protein n=1 Tax=Pseudactinotalea terrae TaxID=1743262 RepID=UPI0012E2C7AD|nr:VOC family protein [Pseudactinotalea terrae]